MIKSYLVPYGYYLKNLVKNNVILTGDAGGLVDPLTGEGIFYAQKSGEIAAKAIIRNFEEKIPLSKYSEDVEKEIYINFEYSLFRRKLNFKNL
jgi:flavin-dependent dehydrogenase